jgi:hypothetical protein
MGEAIGQVLPMALGVAVSPLPIVAVILMLVTPRARVNGPAFVAGWLTGLAAIGVLVIGVLGGIREGGSGPTTWVLWLEGVLGALLLIVALREFRKGPHGPGSATTPGWMGTIDSFTPPKALGAGAFLSALNPKNMLLAAGAAATIAEVPIATSEKAIAYVVFALIATIGVAGPVVASLALGDRAAAFLDETKRWMVQYNSVIMAILCLVIGAKLIGQALGGLTG